MAIKGKVVYQTLKSKKSEIESEHETFSSKIYTIERAIETLAEDREQCYHRIAEIHLPELDPQKVAQELKRLEELGDIVERVYKEKQERRQRIESDITDYLQERNALDEQISLMTSKIERNIDEEGARSKKAAAALAQHPAYTNLNEEGRHAASRLEQNKRRETAFAHEAKEKLAAYTKDPLFMYLVERKFDTVEYRGNVITKVMDTWLANLVNFKENKKNYDFLHRMPQVLAKTIKEEQATVDRLLQEVKSIEACVEGEHGLPEIIEERRRMVRDKGSIVTKLEKFDSLYAAAIEDRKRLDNTKDEYHANALHEYKALLKGKSFAELRQLAKKTPHQEDDRLIHQIEEIDTSIRRYKDEAKEIKKTQQAIAEKLSRVQSIERYFTKKNYETSRSLFKEGLDLPSLLTGYLVGKLDLPDITRTLDTNQYFKRTESYQSSGGGYSGSSSYGSSSGDSDSGSSWRKSSSSSSDWGSSFSSSDSFGGGGFSTSDSF